MSRSAFFVWVVLVLACGSETPLPNPSPTLTRVDPARPVAGSGPLTLTVDGTGFSAVSRVPVDGNERPASTTRVSPRGAPGHALGWRWRFDALGTSGTGEVTYALPMHSG